MNTFKSARRLVAIASLSAVALLAGVSHADTVVVTPSNMSDWTFYSFDSNGDPTTSNGNVGALVTGPATPPLGTGSAELATGTGNGDGSEQIRNTDYNGIKLSDLTSLSYSTFMSQNNGSQMPYLELYINTTGVAAIPGSYDDRLSFEPPYQTAPFSGGDHPDQGASVLNTWQNWNALTGGWYDDLNVGTPGANEGPGQPGVVSLATYLATYPNATIVNATPDEGGVRVSVGYGSSGDTFAGNIDDFVIGTAAGTTTYDFEPTSVPEPASMGLLLVGGSAVLMRRRKHAV
jgi:hypothetical protein